MGLKSGLYIMIFAKRKDGYDGDLGNHSRWLGADYIGEISCENRQSFIENFLERVKEKKCSRKQRSFGIDYYYHDPDIAL